MKYIVASSLLVSLNIFASQSVTIQNKFTSPIIAYYKSSNKSYNAHVEIAPGAQQDIFITRPTLEKPQSISFHWKDYERQETFTFKKVIDYDLILQPAVLITKHKKIIGAIKNQSYSSSSSSQDQ